MLTISSTGVEVAVIKFTDGRIAKILIDRSVSPQTNLDVLELVRLMLSAGVTAASIEFCDDHSHEEEI
jgi:hypothetical protein